MSGCSLEGDSGALSAWKPGGGGREKNRKQPAGTTGEGNGRKRSADFGKMEINGLGRKRSKILYPVFPIGGRKIFKKLPSCNIFVRVE
jgi:hypothetical protein